MPLAGVAMLRSRRDDPRPCGSITSNRITTDGHAGPVRLTVASKCCRVLSLTSEVGPSGGARDPAWRRVAACLHSWENMFRSSRLRHVRDLDSLGHCTSVHAVRYMYSHLFIYLFVLTENPQAQRQTGRARANRPLAERASPAARSQARRRRPRGLAPPSAAAAARPLRPWSRWRSDGE